MTLLIKGEVFLPDFYEIENSYLYTKDHGPHPITSHLCVLFHVGIKDTDFIPTCACIFCRIGVVCFFLVP